MNVRVPHLIGVDSDVNQSQKCSNALRVSQDGRRFYPGRISHSPPRPDARKSSSADAKSCDTFGRGAQKNKIDALTASGV